MKNIEKFYENPPKITNFFSRKYQLKADKTIITGSKKSGKTYIILDFIYQMKSNFLYIDLQDLRVYNFSTQILDDFLKEKNIEILIVENYEKDFTLPNIEKIIISSTDKNLEIQGFEKLHIYPLDFEEFLSFDRKHNEPRHLFNFYANVGRLPVRNQKIASENIFILQDYVRLVLNDNKKIIIFSELMDFISKTFSLYQVYRNTKNKIKISKDKIYEYFEDFKNISLLEEVEKLNYPKSPKKLFLENFALKEALSFKKDFVALFSNIVFCEIQKLNTKIYYTDELDFYLPNQKQGIICSAFTPPEMLMIKIKKIFPKIKLLGIKELFIISVGNSKKDNIDSVAIEIIPFWQWALTL